MSPHTFRHLVFACSGALLLSAVPLAAAAAAPPAAPAASEPAGAPTKPNIMRQASEAIAQPAPPGASAPAAAAPGPAAAGAGSLNREVFGFAQAGALASSSAGYTTWKLSLLSTIAYFGVHVNAADGSLVTNDTGWNVWNSAALADLVARAHAAGARVVLTVVYQDTGAGMCTALQHQSTTIAQTVSEVHAKGVDGVNIDYEGASATCGGSTNKALMTQFAQGMRAALGAGAHLTVDTYGASAASTGGDGFFDPAAMAASVTAFFVMAYELDNSNFQSVGCATYCMSPTSPASFYQWNDGRISDQYSKLVGAGKTILGLPYYGWAACVSSLVENATPAASPQWVANTQLGMQGFNAGPVNIDSHDGLDHWFAFYSTDHSCNRELYIDDASTLGAKYQIVLNKGLRGAGIWSLDMGGGIPALWDALAAHFSNVPGAPSGVTATAGANSATVSWTPPAVTNGALTGYAVRRPDGTALNVPAGTTSATFPCLDPGAAYTFTVQAYNANGGGAVSDPSNSVTVTGAAASGVSYLSWYDAYSPGMTSDNVHVVNPGGTAAAGCVTVAGTVTRAFAVNAGQEAFIGFPGVIGGPVVVTTVSGPAVNAVQRVKFVQSFNETAAQPAAAAAADVYFNWYDHVSSPGFYADNIHVINPGAVTATVSVSIPGIPGCSPGGAIAAGQERVFSCATGFGGPVHVHSDSPVLAAQRVVYYQTFNETAGLSTARRQLEFAWFDHASDSNFRADNIHVSNPAGSLSPADLTITIPGCGSPSAAQMSASEVVYSCPFGSGFGGPVTLVSSVAVIASQRVQYASSFNEAPALDPAAAAATVRLAWYDHSSDPGFTADNVHVLNPAGALSPAQVGVQIPACAAPSVWQASASELVYSCPFGSGFGGPVVVTASGGLQVLASQRVKYYQSFNEAPGE